MAYLFKHILTNLWAYFSTHEKVEPNTFETTDLRKLYVGGPGIKATAKITPPDAAGLPVGTLLTMDMEEYNRELGYHRVLFWKDLENSTFVPAWVTEYFEEVLPGEPELWQLWYDHSGVKIWTETPVDPEPEPEPVEPDPGVELIKTLDIRHVLMLFNRVVLICKRK
jgi:hypothetical protein